MPAPCRLSGMKRDLAQVNLIFISDLQAARSIFVIAGGSCFCCSLPSLLILASSALSSAPTSMAKPVQYNQTIMAEINPQQIRQTDPAAHSKNRTGQGCQETLLDVGSEEVGRFKIFIRSIFGKRLRGRIFCKNSPVGGLP